MQIQSQSSAVSYDELRDAGNQVRQHYQTYADWLAATPVERISHKRCKAVMPTTATLVCESEAESVRKRLRTAQRLVGSTPLP